MLPVEVQHRYGTKPFGPEQAHLEPSLDKNTSAPLSSSEQPCETTTQHEVLPTQSMFEDSKGSDDSTMEQQSLQLRTCIATAIPLQESTEESPPKLVDQQEREYLESLPA